MVDGAALLGAGSNVSRSLDGSTDARGGRDTRRGNDGGSYTETGAPRRRLQDPLLMCAYAL